MKIDRSAWGQLRVTGTDRVRFLMGLTTVNVEVLADGAQGWGASLNPKGRVLSVLNIARVGDAFVITTEPALTEKTRAILEKHAVMDDVAFEPIAGPLHQELGSPWEAPFLPGAGDTPETAVAAEVIRIRAGFVRYGIDVGDDHFPFETPLGRFLDYGKGCYIGQEPVFRVHAQGNAANMLRGLVVAGDAPIPHGAVIHHAAKERAGTITSSVPAGDGTTLALGYLHRSAWDGGAVTIDGRTATVHELPW